MNVELCFWADLKNQMFIEARYMITIVLDLGSVNEYKPYDYKIPWKWCQRKIMKPQSYINALSYYIFYLNVKFYDVLVYCQCV